MFRSWLGLLASIMVLSGCDSTTEQIGEPSNVTDNNLPVRNLPGSVDLSSLISVDLKSLIDGPEEFQLATDTRPCDHISIDPGTEIDYTLEIVEPDNLIDYSLIIVNPGDSWCVADLNLD